MACPPAASCLATETDGWQASALVHAVSAGSNQLPDMASLLPESLFDFPPAASREAAPAVLAPGPCMASTAPENNLILQAQASMQPALPPAHSTTALSLCSSSSSAQPQPAQAVLAPPPPQQPMLQESPALLLPGFPQQQEPRSQAQLLPLSEWVLQQYEASTLFYAGVSPIATDAGLLGVFDQFGVVISLNQFRPYKNCKTSKGCGLVVYSLPSEAAHAMETLAGRFVWPGARSPIVIEWCNGDAMRRQLQQQQRPKKKQQKHKHKAQPQQRPAEPAGKRDNGAPAVLLDAAAVAAAAATVQQPVVGLQQQQLLPPTQQQQQQQQVVMVVARRVPVVRVTYPVELGHAAVAAASGSSQLSLMQTL